MAEDKERLSSSAANAKRNLLFLAVLAWALAYGWVRPRTGDTTVSLGGVGLETTVGVILWGLAAVLAYNLLSFWLHGPFGDRRTSERIVWLLNPHKGPDANERELYEYIVACLGEQALQADMRTISNLDTWLTSQANEVFEDRQHWRSSTERRDLAFTKLWERLGQDVQKRIAWKGLLYRKSRLVVIEDWWDLWMPLLIGASGLLAVAAAFWRLV